MQQVGSSTQGPGRIYFVGGATALLLGIRDQTIDIDIKLDPEPKGIFEAIASMKNEMDINIELTAPDQFLPGLPGWRERSEFIVRVGQVEFLHYDFYGQCLAKILRGHSADMSDARTFVVLGKVLPTQLRTLFDGVAPDLIRYPSINPSDFAERVGAFVETHGP